MEISRLSLSVQATCTPASILIFSAQAMEVWKFSVEKSHREIRVRHIADVELRLCPHEKLPFSGVSSALDCLFRSCGILFVFAFLDSVFWGWMQGGLVTLAHVTHHSIQGEFVALPSRNDQENAGKLRPGKVNSIFLLLLKGCLGDTRTQIQVAMLWGAQTTQKG